VRPRQELPTRDDSFLASAYERTKYGVREQFIMCQSLAQDHSEMGCRKSSWQGLFQVLTQCGVRRTNDRPRACFFTSGVLPAFVLRLLQPPSPLQHTTRRLDDAHLLVARMAAGPALITRRVRRPQDKVAFPANHVLLPSGSTSTHGNAKYSASASAILVRRCQFQDLTASDISSVKRKRTQPS
jgi:hypothetical protein